MRLILTRPREDAGATAAALEALGHGAVRAPLLEIAFLTQAPVTARDYAAVLVSSANAARALAAHPANARLKGALAVAVGPASAAAAGRAGFGRVQQAHGDVEGLIAWVRENLDPGAGPLLYASGAVTTGNLEETLSASGFRVDRAVLYEARPEAVLPEPARTALVQGAADGVLLFSPRTARIWIDLVRAAGLWERARALTHYCLSSNVAAVLADAPGGSPPVAVADRPEEAALIRLIATPRSGLAEADAVP